MVVASYPTLIVHIGSGKTGSTSIQFSLKRSIAELPKLKLAYFGLALEQIKGAIDHPWCSPQLPDALFQEQARDRIRTDNEIENLLLRELERQGKRGVERAIWSNEAFLTRAENIIPILRNISAHGVNVVPIAYIRRHDSWAQSGYAEFGIKSKMYKGSLRPFDEWVKERKISFGSYLSSWLDAFPSLEVYNFDEIINVAEHFLSRVGASEIPIRRSNESTGLPLLAAWAVHNSQFPNKVRASTFRTLARRLDVFDDGNSSIPPLNELLPDEGDLLKVQEDFSGDFELINEILVSQGQPPITFGSPKVKNSEVTSWEIDQLLLKMVFSLQRQVMKLENEIKAQKKE